MLLNCIATGGSVGCLIGFVMNTVIAYFMVLNDSAVASWCAGVDNRLKAAIR